MVSEAAESLQALDYQSVGAFYTTDVGYVVYDGIVYDITNFIANHPGGRDILIPALGTDITDIFNNIHEDHVRRLLGSEKARVKFGIRVVGKLATMKKENRSRVGLFDYQSRRVYNKEDRLGEELRQEVYAYLKQNGLSLRKSNINCIFLLIFFYGLYGLGMYMGFIKGSPLWCLLLGPIATFMAVNVAHTAMHGGFSNSDILNKLGSYLMDAGGYSAFGWNIEHLNHHMSPHTTLDVQTYPGSVVRTFEHQEAYWYHKYQMIYIWFLFLLYTPSMFFAHTYRVLIKYKCVSFQDKIVHLVIKFFGFVLPVSLSFLLFDLATASFNLFLYIMSTSYFSIFLLFIQHEENYLSENENEPWSIRQISTSATWNTKNFVLEWLLGYFNYHIEHHLFPALNPALYPKIQPIVKRLCKKHNVHYNQISYIELVKSQMHEWREFAKVAESDVAVI